MSRTIGSKPKSETKAAKATSSKRAASTKKERTAATTPKSRTAAKGIRSARTRRAAVPSQQGRQAASRPVGGVARASVGHHSIREWCGKPRGLVFGGLRHLWEYALSFIRPYIHK